MGFTGHPPTGTAWGSDTVVEVVGTVLVGGVVGVVLVVAGAVLEAPGSVVPTPETVLDGAPAMVVVVEVWPDTDVDDVPGAPGLGLAVVVVVVVAPATVVGVVAFATAVDVELSGTGSAECADVEVEAITTNATSGARAPTDRTRVRTVGNTAAP
jgi:hypothetical protein